MSVPGTESIESPVIMQEIRAEVDCATRSDVNVLISGERGVGKKAIARVIHQCGPRSSGPFMAVDFSAARLEQEGGLFGEQGSLHQTHTGTLFLNQIGEMAPQAQAQLTQFLETGEVDVRIIAATNRNLYEDVLAGRFREDLYYRLNTLFVAVPSSRERGNVDAGVAAGAQYFPSARELLFTNPGNSQ